MDCSRHLSLKQPVCLPMSQPFLLFRLLSCCTVGNFTCGYSTSSLAQQKSWHIVVASNIFTIYIGNYLILQKFIKIKIKFHDWNFSLTRKTLYILEILAFIQIIICMPLTQKILYTLIVQRIFAKNLLKCINVDFHSQ